MTLIVTDRRLVSTCLCVIMGIEGLTCADEEHRSCLDSMDGDLRVVSVPLQQEGRAADDAVHQEVVFDEIQHLVRHAERGGDTLLPGFVRDTLGGGGKHWNHRHISINPVQRDGDLSTFC